MRFANLDEDVIQTLSSRTGLPIPSDAIHVYGTKDDVKEINDQKLSEIDSELHELKALVIHPTQENYKPAIKKGFIFDSPFLDVLHIKEGARVMLTVNISLHDGLTNGSTGTVSRINKNQNGNVDYILVKFDDEKSGRKKRNDHKDILNNNEESLVPIDRYMKDQSIGMDSIYFAFFNF